MRRPVIDYREFRLSKLNDPQFSHLKLLFGWVVYFAFYFLTENLIPEESCHVVHCYLDDVIPFCEAFLISRNSRPGNPGGSFAYLQMMLAGFLGTRRR